MALAEPMSPVDTTWLRMDQPANPMVITGVLMLERPVDIDRLERVIAARLLALPRFHQRIEPRATGYWWATDPFFSINRHIKRLRLPGPGRKAELQRFVGDLASQRFDMAHPLWDFHIVENYMGGAAVVARIHHSIADGIALIGVMLSLTASDPDAAEHTPLPPFPRPETHQSSAWQETLKAAETVVRRGMQLSQRLVREVRQRVFEPADAIREGTGVAEELAWLLFMPQDSPTRFKGKPHGQKRVAWTDPLALPEVKVVSRVLGCSVNDLLLAAVAGSLSAYMIAKGDPIDGVELRALVPVNLRANERSLQLGNQFGILALELPLGIQNPLARLYEIRRRMEALKRSYEAPVTLGLLSALGYAPRLVQDQLFNLLLSRASAVMTNVPGPQHPLYLAGSRIRQVMFWVPQAGDIAMGISVLSLDGQVQFGVMTDAAVIPDPEAVVARFGAEFEKLLYYVLMEPWSVMAARATGGKPQQSGPPPAEARSDRPPFGPRRAAALRRPASARTSKAASSRKKPDPR